MVLSTHNERCTTACAGNMRVMHKICHAPAVYAYFYEQMLSEEKLKSRALTLKSVKIVRARTSVLEGVVELHPHYALDSPI